MSSFFYFVNFAKNEAMAISYILRTGGTLLNELSVTSDSGDGLYRVRLMYGDVIVQEYINKTKPYSLVFNLPKDVDDNPIRGDYIIRERKEEWNSTDVDTEFTYSYIPIIPSVEILTDGFLSTLRAVDSTTYEGYVRLDRLLTVTPPEDSPLSEKYTTGGELSYEPNVYSGYWTVSIKTKVLFPEEVTEGILSVEDEPVVSEEFLVRPQLNEEDMYLGVMAYYQTYEDNILTSPKGALAMQPTAVRLANLLHQYLYSWRIGESYMAYEAMLAIYDILSPTYLGLGDDVEEIVPYAPTGIDHEHSNLTTLELFTVVEGNLYWNDVLIGGLEETGQVRVNVSDELGYLESKVDDTTIGIADDKIEVKESYIASLADDSTITYSGGKFHSIAVEVTDKTNLVRKWEAGTYAINEMVYLTVLGVDKFYVATTETSVSPLIGTGWREETCTLMRHDVNQDLKLGNHVLECSLSEIVDDSLDIDWREYNCIRILDEDDDDAADSFLEEQYRDLKYFTNVPSEGYLDVGLPCHDITIVYVVDGIGLRIVASEDLPDHVPFNNKGLQVILSEIGDWVRYRFNVETCRLDLVCGSVVGEGDSSAGISLEDLSASNLSNTNDPLVYNSDTGVFALNVNLDEYDNETSKFVKEADLEALVIALMSSINHNDLGGIQDGSPPYDILHVTTYEKAAWGAKQEEITGAATTITDEDLTPDQVLVSDASGKVAVSGVSIADLELNQLAARRYTVVLSVGATVYDRIVGAETEIPSGWRLRDDDAALIIIHNLNKTVFDVVVKAYNSSTENQVMLKGDVAYSTLTDIIDDGEYNSFRMDALATVNYKLYIEIIF